MTFGFPPRRRCTVHGCMFTQECDLCRIRAEMGSNGRTVTAEDYAFLAADAAHIDRERVKVEPHEVAQLAITVVGPSTSAERLAMARALYAKMPPHVAWTLNGETRGEGWDQILAGGSD